MDHLVLEGRPEDHWEQVDHLGLPEDRLELVDHLDLEWDAQRTTWTWWTTWPCTVSRLSQK